MQLLQLQESIIFIEYLANMTIYITYVYQRFWQQFAIKDYFITYLYHLKMFTFQT